MFNSARQEGSTAASLIHFYGMGFFAAWFFDDYFGVIDTSTYYDNSVKPNPNNGGNPDNNGWVGWSSETINANMDGVIFWVFAAIFTVGATVNCIYGMSGFNVGPVVVGPYSVLNTGE